MGGVEEEKKEKNFESKIVLCFVYDENVKNARVRPTEIHHLKNQLISPIIFPTHWDWRATDDRAY